jgi:mycothiol synthase
MIRPYTVDDAPQLAFIHNQVYPQNTYSADNFHHFAADSLAAGGHAWVSADSQLNGFAIVSPLPGLPGIGDLSGCIIPERRRRGLGSELLRALLNDLQESNFWQIAHYLTDLDSPGAHFLRHHKFFVEHEEWQMSLDDLSQLPEISTNQSVHLQTFPRATAVPLFCRLYQESFCGLPWNQPFTPTDVKTTLTDSKDLLFLTLNGQAIGFAWVALHSGGRGLIEPLGIVPAYQQQGFGRVLLISVLRELNTRGARGVEIGAWTHNHAALQLYHSLGFRHKTTYTYLAFNLQDPPS